MEALGFAAGLDEYKTQAEALLDAFRHAEAWGHEIFKHNHPRFLREDVPWAPKWSADEELKSAELDRNDARLALARWYDFADWDRLTQFVDAVHRPDSSVFRFESAAEAMVSGDAAGLTAMLR